MAHYAGYTEEEIDPVFRLMIDYLHRPVSHEAFFKKYASKKFLKGMLPLSSIDTGPPTANLTSIHPYPAMGEEVPPPVYQQLTI